MAKIIKFDAGMPVGVTVVGGSIVDNKLVLNQNGYIDIVNITSTPIYDVEVDIESPTTGLRGYLYLNYDASSAVPKARAYLIGAAAGWSPLYSETNTSFGAQTGSVNTTSIPLLTVKALFDTSNGDTSVSWNGVEVAAGTKPIPHTETSTGAIRYQNIATTSITISELRGIEYITGQDKTTVITNEVVTLTGGSFGATVGTSTLTANYNGVDEDVTAGVTVWSDASLSFTLNPETIPFNDQFKVNIATSEGTGAVNLTMDIAADKTLITCISPFKDVVGTESLFDGQTGVTAVSGSQIEYVTTTGVTVNPNATYEIDSLDSLVSFDSRLYSLTEAVWTTSFTTDVSISNSSTTYLTSLTLGTLNTDGADLVATTTVGTGTLHILSTNLFLKPTPQQIKAGLDADGEIAQDLITVPVSSVGDQSFTVASLPEGEYTTYVTHEYAPDQFTNTFGVALSVLGAEVPPVISVQPISGIIQETMSGSSHTLTVTASPLNSLTWEVNKANGGWVTVSGATGNSLIVNGSDYILADNPLMFRAKLVGGGGAITYTNEVQVSITARPYINLSVTNIPNGTYSAYLYEQDSKRVVYDGEVTFSSNVITNLESSAFTGETIVGVITSNQDTTKAAVIKTVVT